MNARRTASGHAFISYVREDSEAADRIQAFLQAAEIPVWRDTQNLWPGDDWRLKIREAISENSLAFIACFSHNSEGRKKSYQREELILAVEQLRLMAPGRSWFIPVRLDDVPLPPYDLGSGRTLDSIQRVDLIGPSWDGGIARILTVTRGILQSSEPEPTGIGSRSEVHEVKRLLLDPTKRIELEEAVRSPVQRTIEAITDRSQFPTTSDVLTNDGSGLRFLLDRANAYWEATRPVCEILMAGCAWGEPHHNDLWRRTIERVAYTSEIEQGQRALISLRHYPLLLAAYASGIAAVHRGHFDALKAVLVDAVQRSPQRGGDSAVPVIGKCHPWLPFDGHEETAQLLVHQTQGAELTDELIAKIQTGREPKRYTPVSDHLHDLFRVPASLIIDDDADYTETFDQLEILLALISADSHAHYSGSGYHYGPWFGAFTWRSRYHAGPPERRLHEAFTQLQTDWPPLEAGLFGGSTTRAEAAFANVLDGAEKARSRHF